MSENAEWIPQITLSAQVCFSKIPISLREVGIDSTNWVGKRRTKKWKKQAKAANGAWKVVITADPISERLK